MWAFRDYLRAKCADPAFLDRYRAQCTICPTTVMIISAIREQGLSFDDVARRAGVDPTHLDLLESADRCSFDDVQKLARLLDLPVPGVCRKERS